MSGRLRVHGKCISWRTRPRTPGVHRRRGAETRRTFRDRQLASAAAGKNHGAGTALRPGIRTAAVAGADGRGRRSRRAQAQENRRRSALSLRRDFRKTDRKSVAAKMAVSALKRRAPIVESGTNISTDIEITLDPAVYFNSN